MGLYQVQIQRINGDDTSWGTDSVFLTSGAADTRCLALQDVPYSFANGRVRKFTLSTLPTASACPAPPPP
jgi:hypothetical protein